MEDEDHRKADIRRKLWTLTAETWTSREPAPSWTDSVDLLVPPLRYVEIKRHGEAGLMSCVRHWTLDEEADMAIWGTILEHAISQARSLSEPSVFVFEAIAERGLQDAARYVHPRNIQNVR